jgi:ABC-type nitrate/sulfonate/bicarbonate transport system ATPase subunit
MTISPKLRVERLSKSFPGAGDGEEIRALADVSISVGEGEFVSIVGPSGCGKSTLFNIVAGLDEPTSGAVEVSGHESDRLLGSVGLMPQRDLLMPWKSVLDNTAIGPRLAGRSKSESRSIAQSYFTEFGLAGFESKWPGQLSGGMRQRAALLRTFLGGQDLLLLDEPFGALDALTRRTMQAWLLEVWEKHRVTILFITHDVDEAILLSDRVYVMSGRPGGIALELTVDLPRPRSVEMQQEKRFVGYRQQLLEPLGAVGHRTPGGQR